MRLCDLEVAVEMAAGERRGNKAKIDELDLKIDALEARIHALEG